MLLRRQNAGYYDRTIRHTKRSLSPHTKDSPMPASRHRIELRADPDFIARVRARAQEMGLSVSDLARLALGQSLELAPVPSLNGARLSASRPRRSLPAPKSPAPPSPDDELRREPGTIYLVRCIDCSSEAMAVDAYEKGFDPDGPPTPMELAFEIIARVHPVDHRRPVLMMTNGHCSSLSVELSRDNHEEIFDMLGRYCPVDLNSCFTHDFLGLLFLVEDVDDDWALVPCGDQRVRWLKRREAEELAQEFDRTTGL